MYPSGKRNRIMRRTVRKWMSYLWGKMFGCFMRPRAKSYSNLSDGDETIVFVHDIYSPKEKEN